MNERAKESNEPLREFLLCARHYRTLMKVIQTLQVSEIDIIFFFF